MKLKELEKQFSQARLKAEHTIPTGPRHPWSPQLRQAQLLVMYYKLWLSQYNNHKDFHHQRQRYGLTNIQDPTNKSQAQQLLRKAQTQLKDVILHAGSIRERHLEDRADMAARSGNMTKAKAIQAIKRQEALQQMYRKIRRITKRIKNNGFTHLIVTQQEQRQIITEPQDMFHHLIARNLRHFGQDNGTPLHNIR